MFPFALFAIVRRHLTVVRFPSGNFFRYTFAPLVYTLFAERRQHVSIRCRSREHRSRVHRVHRVVHAAHESFSRELLTHTWDERARALVFSIVL